MNSSLAAQVQQSRIDALQRRAALHQGAARRAIEDRLQALRSGVQGADGSKPPAPPTPQANRVCPLAALVAQLARQQPPSAELKAVRDHRGTWVQLGLQQRLTQTRAQVPDNAGPLNTQRLMHQALSLMGEASPAYLQHFMAHVEALLALDALNAPAAEPRKDRPRAGRSG